jgi:hypothetical protein
MQKGNLPAQISTIIENGGIAITVGRTLDTSSIFQAPHLAVLTELGLL